MKPIWDASAVLPRFQPLRGDIARDVAVIGGGMAGVLTAYFLQKQGLRVAVVEAGRVGSGQTGKTTAKITAQHGLIYTRLIGQLGEDGARQYARANLRAIEDYRALIAEEGIDCEFEERPAYLYSTHEIAPLEQEAKAYARLGIPADFTTHTTLPFPVTGAVRMEGQAQFHPLKFLGEIARRLEIYEDTRVLRVEGEQVITDRGTVQAPQVVFACHYPFVNAPGYYFLRLHQERSYVLALEGAGELDGMYYGVDEDGLSFRNAGKYLLLGGGNHRTGENRCGGKYESLRQAACRLYPDSREVARWSAQDVMPASGVPCIGRFSADRPNWYVATGFQKWGMSTSMAAARILTAAIAGKEDMYGAVFSPSRLHLSASVDNLLEDGKHAALGLSRTVLAPPRALVEDLPLGHGGVVEWEGHKMGVYREETGEVHVVSIRCPHLGCQLEWNSDEKSWDCPCHGSRFDWDGELLEGPAQTDLETGE